MDSGTSPKMIFLRLAGQIVYYYVNQLCLIGDLIDMYQNKLMNKLRILLFSLCVVIPFYICALPAYATQDQLNAEAEERKNNTVETNEIEDWPTGPRIGADAAVLMDADTGVILYSKNMDGKEFPASTTKVMTSLLAIENCELNEIITVSQSAIDANASDGSNMGLTAGEQLTLEQILYGILINSANEGCNAVGEHIAGSMDGFVDMMNARAKELGCTNTHFVTTNGLHDEEHYTSAHDLALIAREFFKHDILCQMARTTNYVIEETATHKEHRLKTHNKLYEGMEYAYPYLVGSKTGFTSHSRQCLVSCAEKDGIRLICVIMREESPYQFEDTVNLFEYGFANFTQVNVAANEKNYELSQAAFFDSGSNKFGSTKQLLNLDEDSTITLPKGVDFSDLESSISYQKTNSLTTNDEQKAIATVDYSYHSMYLGSARIILDQSTLAVNNFVDSLSENSVSENAVETVYVDVRKMVATIIAIVVLLIFGLFVYARKMGLQKRKKRRRRGSKNSYRRSSSGTKRSSANASREPGSSRMRGMDAGKTSGMKTLHSSSMAGLQSISRGNKDSDLSLEDSREHTRVSKPKPKKKKQPSKVEQMFMEVIDSISDLSDAKHVEEAKQARYERERRMKERLREEAEQHRISGQSSIRTRQNSPRISSKTGDDYFEEAYESQMGSRRSRNDYDNISDYEEHKKRRSTSGTHKRSGNKNRSPRYTQEELEILERQERRRRLAEQRRRQDDGE